jgi:hypothetical protein
VRSVSRSRNIGPFVSASHWRDLNPRPADYESAALPTELQWRNRTDERNRPIMVAPARRRTARVFGNPLRKGLPAFGGSHLEQLAPLKV